VVVDVGLFVVVARFVRPTVIVAMGNFAVVVFVGVPESAVTHLPAMDVVRDVPVVVRVRHGRAYA